MRASYSKPASLGDTSDPDACKATQVLADHVRINNRSMASVDFANSPIYTSGVGTSSATLAAGSDLSVLGIGLKKSF